MSFVAVRVSEDVMLLNSREQQIVQNSFSVVVGPSYGLEDETSLQFICFKPKFAIPPRGPAYSF